MNNLIEISSRHIGANGTQTVNARELHAFLGSCQDFSTWIKKRIADYGFSEGVDYVRIALEAGMRMAESGGPIGGIGQPQKNGAVESMGYSSFGQQGRIEYAISLDMAKELAMVERNDKGKQARQYFIECERKAKSTALMIPQSLPEALRLAANLADQKAKVDAALALAAPKAVALDRIATADDGAMCVTNAAKSLKMRPKDLFNWLQAHRWIYRRPGSATWLAYQDRLQSGLLSHKVTTVERTNGEEAIATQVLVTPKGLARLAEVACAEPVPV